MLFGHLIERREMANCLLCEDAPCTRACGRVPCGDLLRSLWLDNQIGAAQALPTPIACMDCDAPCERACVVSAPVPIQALMQKLARSADTMEERTDAPVDLRVDLCGVTLENPFLLSSSVVASSYEMCARAFQMGWAGAAFKTLCLFPIQEASPRFAATRDAGGAFMGFKNIEQLSEHSLESNLDTFRRLKRDYPTKALVASIMGRDESEWTTLAKLVTEAGADVIECNFSCPNMADEGLGSDVGQHPELVRRFTQATRAGSRLPILAKMTPNLGSMLPPAIAAVEGGATGIAAINTIKSVCNVNLDAYVTATSVRGQSAVGGYSGAAVKPIALRFISELASCDKLRGLHVSGMGGVYTWRDALEFMLLGAGSIQITTAVMEYGYRIIDDLLSGLSCYLREKGFASTREVVGLAVEGVVASDALERQTVLLPRFDADKCLGCGRCYVSCRDGGHHAIEFNADTRRPKLNGRRCVGCHLCMLVCPARAIGPSVRRIAKQYETD